MEIQYRRGQHVFQDRIIPPTFESCRCLINKVLTSITRLNKLLFSAIPGGYTDWFEWGECSVTCGGGVQTRKRTCTNPPPSGGGPTCIEQNLGPAEEQKECNSQDCGESV